MPRKLLSVFLCVSAALCLCVKTCPAVPPVDFQRQVQPILAEHCTVCHGVDATDRKSELRLDLRSDALKGGESGSTAIVPGRP